MSEIQGLGPTQPLRPASAARPSIARPAERLEEAPGFGSDAVHVSRVPLEFPAAPAPPERIELPHVPMPVLPRVELPTFQEVDGFIVAGGGQAPSCLSRGADAGRTFSTGPIAMIDEPTPATVEFPGLSLNGPSTAGEGLFSLGGLRLA